MIRLVVGILIIFILILAEFLIIRRFSSVYRRNFLILFFLSAAAAIPVSFLQGFLNQILASIPSALLYDLIQAFGTSSMIEEPVKLLLVLLTAALIKKGNRERFIMKRGATAAIGFALMENILYSINQDSALLVSRMLTSVPLHLAATLLAVTIAAKAFSHQKAAARQGCYIGGLFAAWLLHAGYNFLLMTGDRIGSPAAEVTLFSLAMLSIGGVFIYIAIQHNLRKENGYNHPGRDG